MLNRTRLKQRLADAPEIALELIEVTEDGDEILEIGAYTGGLTHGIYKLIPVEWADALTEENNDDMR